jgi:hypothetical protein
MPPRLWLQARLSDVSSSGFRTADRDGTYRAAICMCDLAFSGTGCFLDPVLTYVGLAYVGGSSECMLLRKRFFPRSDPQSMVSHQLEVGEMISLRSKSRKVHREREPVPSDCSPSEPHGQQDDEDTSSLGPRGFAIWRSAMRTRLYCIEGASGSPVCIVGPSRWS